MKNATLMEPEKIAEIERSLEIVFQNKQLLVQSLTHQSFVNEHHDSLVASNERMEFLGDSIISAIVTEELYRKRPDMREGDLTTLRSQLIREGTLARVAQNLKLGTSILFGKGEAEQGPSRKSNLANAFEALVGAIFLDKDYNTTRQFVLSRLDEDIESVLSSGQNFEPKNMLQEIVQSKKWPLPLYMTKFIATLPAGCFRSEVTIYGGVKGVGLGTRKVDAEQKAAAEVLIKLKLLPQSESSIKHAGVK